MIEEIKRMYETSGEIDEATYVEVVTRNLWKPGQLRRMLLMGIIGILLGSYMLYAKIENAWILLLVYGLWIFLAVWMPRKVKKSAHLQFSEAAPDGKLAYTSSFSEERIYLVNHTSGGSGELKLSQVKKLIGVGELWVLLSKGGLFYAVFASRLSQRDRESLLALLKQNNPKIKIQLPKER